MEEWRQAFVAMGANLGDRRRTLRTAIQDISSLPQIDQLLSSSIYETEPVGNVTQPMFLNMVVGFQTTLSPEELLAALLKVEIKFGRTRLERWGPRTLDLDLLAYEGARRATRDLELPHPRMLQRSFVLVPLRELLAKPFFQKKHWDELRKAVDQSSGDAHGVLLYGSSVQQQ